MVIQDFLDNINKFNFVHACGAYDIFDRCVYILTFTIILLCSGITTIKSYILEPMTCYIPNAVTGANVVPYVNNYCWIIGTTAKGIHEHNVEDENFWTSLESRRINYYQWVPFVLGLQAAILYLPYVFWECMIYNRLGTNLQFIVDIGRRSALDFGESRQKKISQMASNIFVLLSTRIRKYGKSNRLLSTFSFHKMEIFFYYFLLKLSSIGIITSQFLIMERFLNMNGRYRFFGITLLHDLVNGLHWDKTNLFPRMSFCRVPLKMPPSPMNLQAQCSLSVNILNEKIFIFLWWWFGVVAAMQTLGCALWVWRCLLTDNRVNFIKHSLLVNEPNLEHPHEKLKNFDQDLLSVDGSFLIHMIRLNCGDLISNELIQHLLNVYNANNKTKVLKWPEENISFNSTSSDKEFDKAAFV